MTTYPATSLYAPTQPTRERSNSPATIAVFIASALVAIGSLMAWAKVLTVFGSISVSGFDGDGKITLGCAAGSAVFAGVSAARGRRGYVLPTLALLAGLASLGTGMYDSVRAQQAIASANRQAQGFAHLQVGAGLWIVDVASVALVIGTIALLVTVRRFGSTDATTSSGYASTGAPTHWTNPPAVPAAAMPSVVTAVPNPRPAPKVARTVTKSQRDVPARVIREWAMENGVPVNAQGPIPRHVREQYTTQLDAV